MAGIVVLSLVVAAGSVNARQKDAAAPFKIGIVTSTSGPGFGFGQRAIIGIRYRVEEEINKSGGING